MKGRIFMGKLAKHTSLTMCKVKIGIRLEFSVNVFLGPEQEKIMMTGLHRVCDIHCKSCLKAVGWTYVSFF